MELAFFLIALTLTGIGIYFLVPSITGFIIKEFNYEDKLNLVVTASGNYTWNVENAGELKSIKLDGKVTSYGKARVYIENNGIRYLIFDSTRLNQSASLRSNDTNINPITGFAVGNNGNNNNQNDKNKQKQNKKPDWIGPTRFIINGTTELNLSKYFIDKDNGILIYAVSQVEDLEISISGEILTVKPKKDDDFNTTITFTASDGIGSGSETVNLVVIANKKAANNPPIWNSAADAFVINGTLKINLSQYFDDKDNDTLSYNYTLTEGIAISLENETMTLTAIDDYSGNTSVILSAYDGKNSTIKNVTLIAIKELNITEPINETNKTSNISKTISIALEYNNGTIYDANDNGEESINGVVDLSVAKTKFNWNVDENRLCTRWEVYNIEEGTLTTFCNGNNGCCAFAGLLPTRENWSEVYYSTFGKDSAGYNNIVSAQVLHYDVNLSSENPKSEIYYSNWSNLSVKFYKDEVEFGDVCEDTCVIRGLNKSSYTLVFEIEDGAVLRIDKIKYSALVDVKNNPPILMQNISNIRINKDGNMTLNLSKYFSDPDNDVLNYDYYRVDNLTITFENDMATIIPDENFTGERFTFITANDSENSVVSNLFKIAISEQNLSENISENRLIIQNLSGSTIGVFDSAGNVNIKGIFIEGIEPISDEDDFIMRNSSNGLNLVITNPEGILMLKGNLNQNLSSPLIPTFNSFIIENISGNVVLYVNSTGSLFLTGELTQNVSFG